MNPSFPTTAELPIHLPYESEFTHPYQDVVLKVYLTTSRKMGSSSLFPLSEVRAPHLEERKLQVHYQVENGSTFDGLETQPYEKKVGYLPSLDYLHAEKRPNFCFQDAAMWFPKLCTFCPTIDGKSLTGTPIKRPISVWPFYLAPQREVPFGG